MLTQARLKKARVFEGGMFLFHDRSPCSLHRMSVDGEIYQAHKLAWLYLYGKMPNDSDDSLEMLRKIRLKAGWPLSKL